MKRHTYHARETELQPTLNWPIAGLAMLTPRPNARRRPPLWRRLLDRLKQT